jgi:hypothetical protein
VPKKTSHFYSSEKNFKTAIYVPDGLYYKFKHWSKVLDVSLLKYSHFMLENRCILAGVLYTSYLYIGGLQFGFKEKVLLAAKLSFQTF